MTRIATKLYYTQVFLFKLLKSLLDFDLLIYNLSTLLWTSSHCFSTLSDKFLYTSAIHLDFEHTIINHL